MAIHFLLVFELPSCDFPWAPQLAVPSVLFGKNSKEVVDMCLNAIVPQVQDCSSEHDPVEEIFDLREVVVHHLKCNPSVCSESVVAVNNTTTLSSSFSRRARLFVFCCHVTALGRPPLN